jgi:ribonucleoside-diphosphate reductase alpha chain
MFSAALPIEKYTSDLSNVDISLIQKDVDRAAKDLELHPTRRKEIFNLLALTCNDKALIDPQWALLAGRLLMEVIHAEIPSTFGEATEKMEPILNPDYFQFVMKNKASLEAILIPENDFTFDCFAVATLRKSYLAHLKVDDQSLLMECPQYMYLRVATYLHYPDLNEIRRTYISLSNGYYSQATPTLFNSGMLRPQLSSCFLSSVSDDMRGITKAWHDQAVISKNSGGLGCDYSNIRHSEIGQHGFSRGLTPWLKISNEILKTVDQCFGPDTIVYSSKGPKRIKDILPGDKLVRENGSFGRVAKLLEYPVSEDVTLHSFKTQHAMEPVVVANCHPMLAFKYPSGSGSYKIIRERLDQGKIVPEYIDVGDLDKDYFVAIPIPVYERDLPCISLEDCRMYGILLGDGYINKKRNEYKVYLNDKSKKETCEFVEEYLQNRNIQFWVYKDKGCKSYGWAPSPKTFPFTRKMLYTNNGDKRICSTMLNLPVEKCLQIFKGVMETDGCYRTGGEIQIEQSSRHLADGIRFILLKAGIPTSGNVRDRVGNISILKRGDQITTQKVTYNLRIPKTDVICDLLDRDDPSAKLSYFVYDNKIWSRVTTNKILKRSDDTPVHIYDIEMENPEGVEENANYLTSVGLAHNGGKRKGSGTIYVRDWHVDVYEFIELRDEGPEDMRAKDLFLALMVSDLFMKRVRDDAKWSLFCPNKAKGLTEVWGDKFEQLYLKYEADNVATRTVNARDLWSHILNMQIKKGMPFILYMDACNSKSNQQHTGMVRCSNLCVAGNTQILTKEGYFPIRKLEGEKVKVWNGEEWSKVRVKKTGTNKDLIKVYLSDGSELECTPEHKFYVQKTYHGSSTEVPAGDLQVDDKLIKWDAPIFEIETDQKFPYPYTHGFYCGDGTDQVRNGKRMPRLTLYGEKIALKTHLDYTSKGNVLDQEHSSHQKLNLGLSPKLKPKYTVPLNYSIKTRLQWFAGLCDADGTIARNGTNESLQVGSIDKKFLLKVKLMLTTLGVHSKVTLCHPAKKRLMPDGKGGQKEFDCQPFYRLIVSSYYLQRLLEQGLEFHRLKVEVREPQRAADTFVKVVKIEDASQGVDTFCFTEPKRHMGVFNGILTGQCTEIALNTGPDNLGNEEIASCTLSSVAIAKCVKYGADNKPYFDFDMLERLTAEVVRNLNMVIDRNYYPEDIPEIRYSNMRHRPLGIGVQGYADAVALLDMTWVQANPDFDPEKDQPESKYVLSTTLKEFNAQVFETMYYAAIRESIELAKVFGSYKTFTGSPASKGKFQFDMWGWSPGATSRYGTDKWQSLRDAMKRFGLRNSTLLSIMPTASSAHILGNQEACEPFTELIFARTVLSGQFMLINKHIVRDLKEIGMWTDETIKTIINTRSLDGLTTLDPVTSDRLDYIKLKYLTVFEIPQKAILQLGADRGKFICQTESRNCFMARPTRTKLNAYHFYAWAAGLKTGMYYLRQRSLADPINFSADTKIIPTGGPKKFAKGNVVCTDEVCLSCNA